MEHSTAEHIAWSCQPQSSTCHKTGACAGLQWWSVDATIRCLMQIESEFPMILGIKESLKKYVFEPAAEKKAEVRAAVKEMRGR
eukprot:355515-Chlamydomonas_euryale.AAC.9